MKTYRFQQYLELAIETHGKARFAEYFDNEYRRVDETNSSNAEPAVRITVEIVDVLPSASELEPDSEVIERKESFKKLFNYEFAIVNLHSDNIQIYFRHHPVANIYTTAVGVFLQAQVLEPVIYLAMLRKGILLMHSAGVTRAGKSFVFPAYGGTGKTTTCMSLLQKGYHFLGDDLLLIDPDQRLVYPYPRPLHVFTYNIRNLQGARVPFSLMSVVYFKNLVRYFFELLLRTEFLISTRVHADEIIPEFELSPPGDLHNVIFLKKEGQSETIDLSTRELVAQHAQNIVESADLNMSLYRFLDAEEVAAVKAMELEVTSKVLNGIDYFGYLNTRLINLENVSLYLDNVEA
ncbi:MAG: hypothetical protein KTR32_40070 [Granulosicoccus sp.]|nr:hypothetical protein [Granulosicoccus sp.]